MKRLSILAVATGSLLVTPLLAGPPVRRPTCQLPKAQPREAKRAESCRKAPVPPLVDQTPMFLVSTSAAPSPISDLS